MDFSFNNSSFSNGGAALSANSTSTGVSMASLYNTDALDRKYEYKKTKESYELEEGGDDTSLSQLVKNIDTYIKNGEEDKVLGAYNTLLEQMGKQTRYQKIAQDATTLKSVANTFIEQNIEGCDNLQDYIRENTSDAAETLNKEILYWGNADSTSQEDLLKEMYGLDEDKHINLFTAALSAVGSIIAAPFNFLTGAEKH